MCTFLAAQVLKGETSEVLAISFAAKCVSIDAKVDSETGSFVKLGGLFALFGKN